MTEEMCKDLISSINYNLKIGADIFLADDEAREIVKILEEPSDYNQGLNDAWELFKKVLEMPGGKICEHILEGDSRNPCLSMVNCLTPQEALAKLKAYEEVQNTIEVGDVVKDNYDEKGVVLDETESYYSVFTQSGCVQTWLKSICKKTGEHIDIQSVLQQIGGE